jgi:peptidoglycan hydrolase CwlO-like protein
MIGRIAVVMLAATTLLGCGDNKAREAKREQDRMMMRLQDADKEKTQMQTQIDQLKASLDTASAKSRQAQDDLAKMQDQLRQAQTDLRTAQSSATASAELQKRLTDLQSQNEQLGTLVKTLQRELATAKENAAKIAPATSPAPTQPTLNK